MPYRLIVLARCLMSIMLFATFTLPVNPVHAGTLSRLPANAMPSSSSSTGWRCKYGFERSGDQCRRIILPPNAALNRQGDGWECRPGFDRVGNQCVAQHRSLGSRVDVSPGNWRCRTGYKLVGGVCKRVLMPDNAEFSRSDSEHWRCRDGYHRAGYRCVRSELPRHARWLDREKGIWTCEKDFFRSGRRCVKYPAPKYSHPSDSEPLGYRCRSGYRNSGGQCVKMEVPRNASLTLQGNTWECNPGFERRGRRCIPIVYRETYIKNDFFTDTLLCGDKHTRTVTGACSGRYVVGTIQLCSKNQFFKGEIYYPGDDYTSEIKGKQMRSGRIVANDTLANYCELGFN